MALLKHNIRKIPSSLKLISGFIVMILIGAVLLTLPISSKNGRLNFIDSLFVSTSAVCVTGLSTVHIANTFSAFGTTVLMFLFQIGGLGFAVVAVAFLTLTQNATPNNGDLLRDYLGANPKDEIKKLLRVTLLSTFIFEFIGWIVLSFAFSRRYPIKNALYLALFTSISSYNNAGFDLFRNSLQEFNNDPFVLITVAVLIILGGLGFIYYMEILIHKRRERFPLHFKIVTSMTISLTLIGTLLYFISGKMNLLNSFFQSVTTRTAGFSSIDQTTLNGPAYVLTLVLMFIGASPGSTGGGLKTTTVFTAIKASFSLVTGRSPVAFKRNIASDSIMKAFFVIVISIFIVVISFFILCTSEKQLQTSEIFFEVISAYATVGLSQSTTPLLTSTGKIIVIFLMFIGRVGILSIVSLFMRRKLNVRYLDDKVVIG